jgi:cytochrome b561
VVTVSFRQAAWNTAALKFGDSDSPQSRRSSGLTSLESMQPPVRYTTPAIALHWMIFVSHCVQLHACGLYVAVPLSPLKLKYYSWHKWIGVTVFALAVARVAWARVQSGACRATAPSALAKACRQQRRICFYTS